MADLRPDHLAIVQAILKAELPDTEVWVFGSRAKGTARESSDLDLAILGAQPLPLRTLMRLRRAFEDSIAHRPLSFNADIRGLIARPHVLPEYLLHSLRGSRQALRTHLRTGPRGIPRLPAGSLASFLISLPPMEEQRDIARVLGKMEDRLEREPHLRDSLLSKLASGEVRAREAEKMVEEASNSSH